MRSRTTSLGLFLALTTPCGLLTLEACEARVAASGAFGANENGARGGRPPVDLWDSGSMRPTVEPQPSTPDAGGGHVAPRFVIPPTEPLPVAPLAPRPRAPYAKKALPKVHSLGVGGVVLPAIPSPDRLAVAVGQKGALLDARTGKVLAKLPTEPHYVSPAAGVVTLEGKPPRLVRLSDATLVTPTLDLGGRRVKEAWLAASPAQKRALALAETESGEKLVGLSSDDLATFHLAPAPFAPSATHYSGIVNALDWQVTASVDKWGGGQGTPYTFAHEPGCVRARVADDGAVTCLEHLPKTSPNEETRWLSDGYFSFGVSIGHVSWGSDHFPIHPLANGSLCSQRGSRIEPPRSVVSCHGTTDALLWAPGKLLGFTGPADPNDLGGLIGADAGPVLPIPDGARVSGSGDALRTSTKWLDLVGLRMATTPSMRPLDIASFAGVGSVALAEERVGKTSNVWLLDFAAGALDLVAEITDCPGQLAQLRESRLTGPQRSLVLACMTPEMEHTVSRLLLWAEVVDPSKRIRYRTPLMPEALFDDGLVVLSTRRALAAESTTAQGTLFSVDLLAP